MQVQCFMAAQVPLSATSTMSSCFSNHGFTPAVAGGALTRVSSMSCTSALTPSYPPDGTGIEFLWISPFIPTASSSINLQRFRRLQGDPSPRPPIFWSKLLSTFWWRPTAPSTTPWFAHLPPPKPRHPSAPNSSPPTSIQGPRQLLQVKQRVPCTTWVAYIPRLNS